MMELIVTVLEHYPPGAIHLLMNSYRNARYRTHFDCVGRRAVKRTRQRVAEQNKIVAGAAQVEDWLY